MIFEHLDFETVGNCNRVCPTCIRNSHPDRDALKPWFSGDLLPISIMCSAIDEAIRMGFSGTVCLSHYNEPLMDKRLVQIVRYLRTKYSHLYFYFHTNGDYLAEDIAKALDGHLDRIVVTLYMDEPKKSERAQWVHTLFDKTICDVITQSTHIATHFSPNHPVKELAKAYKEHTCFEPSMRVVINHRRQFLMCCDDVIGNFNLGTFPEKTIAEHWEEKQELQKKLAVRGGRKWHPYCESCPRP